MDLIVSATEQHLARLAHGERASDAAFEELFGEYLSALRTDASRTILAPGFRPKLQPAADVAYDQMAGDETLFARLLRVAALAANAGIQDAGDLFHDMARKHAEYHCDDLALSEGA